MNSAVQLAPTYQGFIASTYDALILFEACLSGHINHVARRPQDREREHVIKSGNIFIYEEHSSGIKRWTDGISWSPSRILGNFLIYRQLVKPFGPGEKKKALKKTKGPTGITKSTQVGNRPRTAQQVFGNPVLANGAYGQVGQMSVEQERSLIGSLIDSYDFMDDGLVKKTISVTLGDVTHHLVSYYTTADAMIEGKFMFPSRDPRFSHLQIRPALLTKQNFRTPIEELDPMERPPYGRSYNMVNQSMMHHSMPYSTAAESHPGYNTAVNMYQPAYGPPAVSQPYESNVPTYQTNVMYANTNGGQYPPTNGYPVAQRMEQFPTNNDYRQRYSIASNSSSDGSRAQMPAAHTARRNSAFPGSNHSDDSGIGMTMDTRPTPEAAFGQPGYYNTTASRDPVMPPNMMAQKALPTPPEHRQPPPYERPAINNNYRMPIDTKDATMWSMNGNASMGHGHYQPQWASATH